MSKRRAATSAVAVGGLVLVSACAGPKSPFDIGTHTEPLSLTLGQHTAVVLAPVGPGMPDLPPVLPVVDVPEESPVPVPTPTLGPCPNFDPLSPVAGVGLDIPKPPGKGTYKYRATTTDQVGKTVTKFKGDTTWKVSLGQTTDALTGGYDVTTEVTIGKAKTTRVFRVLTQPLAAGEPGAGVIGDPASTDLNRQLIDTVNGLAGTSLPRIFPTIGKYGPAGVYLVEQKTATSDFKPIVPIPLVQSPVDDRNAFTAVGTDGTTIMLFNSSIKKKAIVNACGKKIETVEVELGNGVVVQKENGLAVSIVNFTETLDFALQYGGIPVRDFGTVSGAQLPGQAVLPDTIKRTFDYTINQVPNPPKVP